MKNKQTPQEMSDASIPSLRVKLLLRGQSPRNVILWLMGIALFLQLLIPLGQAGTRKVVARRGSSKVSQGDISSLIGSGESSAGHGSVLPQQAQGPVYSEIPGPAHDEDEESVEPTIPVPQGKAWNTIPSPAVRATEAPATTKLQTPNFEPQAPNDVVTQITHDITPSEVSATQRSAIHEPSVGNAGNTLFMSANWYAARSSDGGNTFSYVNPYTTFPSVNGGFCCDQIVNYARNQDMTLWALQYVKDASSGTLRIARAVGSTDVLNNSWIYYDFNPQMFGFASGNWMDFPNLSLGSTFLYATSNVFRTSDNGFTGSVIWRIPLSQLAAGGSISFSYFTRTDVGGLRCTEGAATTMYWASFANTSTMRIFRWDDSSGSIFWDNVALNPFTYLNRDGVSMTPDGRNWVARADSRVLGASVTGGVIALIWGAKQDATFPQPYTVAARFSQSNRALLTQQQIWNPEFAWLYMNASVNSAGNQAGLIAYGGGALYPNSAFWINDDVQSGFAPLNNYVVASSTAGPAGNAWGDFLTTRTHKDFPNSWVATTYYMTAGGGNSNAVGRYMWIGRQRDLPPACTPSSISFGGTINGTLIVTDCRSPARGTQYYADQYSFSATAGQRITTTLSSSAFDTYLYLRGTTGSVIADDDDGGGGTNSRIPAGSGFFTVPTTGTYTIEATSFDQLSTGSYTLNLALAVSRTLTVASSNPGSGVSITVSPNDNNGQGNGVTQFTRVYDDAANAVLTAPATAGGNNFQKWQRDSADFSFNQTATVTMNANHTMTAVYVTQPSPNRTLTVASSNPSSGVTITVSPNDNNSQGDGVTQFNRVYNNNTVVSLTAPSSATGNNFSKWQRDGADFSFS
ncbi:MAG: pre-peptidase C-terminal domain-containing protein, partial [Acidobacteriota bacterium]